MNKRDNFTQKTKEILAKRVAYLCSNPNCQKQTVGASLANEKFVNIGIAAHITAASINGPRYNDQLTVDERKNIANAIWLCSNCASLIDKDDLTYTVNLLLKWKKISEEKAKRKIENNINCPSDNKNSIIQINSDNITFSYNQKGFSCNIKYNFIKETICFQYFPSKENWNEINNELNWEDPFYFMSHSFKNKLQRLIEKNNETEIYNLILEVKKIISLKGIQGVSEYIFNTENKKHGIPPYQDFIKAFELFIEKDIKYEPKIVGHLMYFKTEKEEYTINTYEGKVKELKSFVENFSTEEIYTMTNKNIWSEIYIDAGILKEDFVPQLLDNWEIYWDNLFQKILKEVGSIEHLKSLKNKSYRQFQTFIESYNDIGNIIQFAYKIDDYALYPLCVLTMLQIFDAECCFLEYCEWEFESLEWSSIWIDEEDENLPIFYIKPI